MSSGVLSWRARPAQRGLSPPVCAPRSLCSPYPALPVFPVSLCHLLLGTYQKGFVIQSNIRQKKPTHMALNHLGFTNMCCDADSGFSLPSPPPVLIMPMTPATGASIHWHVFCATGPGDPTAARPIWGAAAARRVWGTGGTLCTGCTGDTEGTQGGTHQSTYQAGWSLMLVTDSSPTPTLPSLLLAGRCHPSQVVKPDGPAHKAGLEVLKGTSGAGGYRATELLGGERGGG